MAHYNPFHTPDPSPWPIILSINIMLFMISMIYMINYKSMIMSAFSMLTIILSSSQWWRDVIRESTFQGSHTSITIHSMKIASVLFILSEVMFFFSFFWAFFHSSLSPAIQIGAQWPPQGIITFNPTLTPLLNTVILINSGITITWSHHSSINYNYTSAFKALSMTIILGLYFSILQMWEYYNMTFSMADSVYGAVFFIMTGFHGLHIVVGITFLSVMLYRSYNLHFSSSRHFGFEAAAWYWHFIDIVWLFLYSMVYWWGS